jgi:hypothetical protein
MSLAEVKESVAEMTLEERLELVGFIAQLNRSENPASELSAYPVSALAEAYLKESPKDRDLDDKLSQASAKPSPGELD